MNTYMLQTTPSGNEYVFRVDKDRVVDMENKEEYMFDDICWHSESIRKGKFDIMTEEEAFPHLL